MDVDDKLLVGVFSFVEYILVQFYLGILLHILPRKVLLNTIVFFHYKIEVIITIKDHTDELITTA